MKSNEARILSVKENILMVEFVQNPKGTSKLMHHLTHIRVTDPTQVVDINDHLTRSDVLKPGMIIDVTARKLSPYTLSMFAYTIQITCDQDPCYLGIEGRS